MSSFVQPHASLLAPECRQSRSSGSGLASTSSTSAAGSGQGGVKRACNSEHGGELEFNPEDRTESEYSRVNGGELQCNPGNEAVPACTYDHRQESGYNTESEPQSTNSPLRFSSLRSASPLYSDHPVGAAVSALLSLSDCTSSGSPSHYDTSPSPRVSTPPLNQSLLGHLQSESPLTSHSALIQSRHESPMPKSDVG